MSWKKKQRRQPEEIKDKLVSKSEVNQMSAVEISQLIEQHSTLILENPEENINNLIVLNGLLEHEDAFVVQMALISLSEIFLDIVPLNKINEKDNALNLENRLNKEDRKLIQFENALLEHYGKYIEALRCFMTAQKKNATTLKIAQTSMQCICNLTKRLFHFNRCRDLANQVVYQITNEDEYIQESSREAITYILQQSQHSLFEMKILILNALSRIFIEKKEESLPDWFIDCINCTEIDTKFLPREIEKEDRERRRDIKKKRREFFAQNDKDKKDKREKKDLKEKLDNTKKIMKEVKEAQSEAAPDLERKTIASQNGQILEKLFYIYFKVIKLMRISKFYESALDGILKFVHLINVELISGLIDNLIVLCKFLRSSITNKNFVSIVNYRLQTIYALQQIINGPGQAFDIDDKQTIMAFYAIILDMNKKQICSGDFERTILENLQTSFLKRRQLSLEVVASFIKEIATLIQSTNDKLTYSLLFLLKILFQKYSKCTKMLDADNDGLGVNRYNVTAEDPASTNAINTSIYVPLQKLKEKYKKDPKYTSLIGKILRNEPLPQHLISKKPLELYDQ